MKTQCALILVMCLFILNCGLSDSGPVDEDYPGIWIGEDIDFKLGGLDLVYDVVVTLTETNYEIDLCWFPDLKILYGSSRGTHTGLIESSAAADVWNTLTLTHAVDNNDNWQPIEGDEDYAAFWIEGSTMHFKYAVDANHGDGEINATGDLIKQ